jgi:hypothetical protein
MPPEAHVSDIARTIQLAVAPVFLLTALGTILGVFSNRLGRIVDRTRLLAERVREARSDELHQAMLAELDLLATRRHYVNYAITSATMSALLVCLVIAAAFVGFILRLNFSEVIAALFVAAMAAAITALLCFLREVLLAVSSPRNPARA